MDIEIKILNEEFYKTHELPKPATDGSAAIDLYATEDYVLEPGSVMMIGTGLAMWIGSYNYEGRDFPISFRPHMTGVILPRSGLGHKGLILGNSVGLIDEDYQGELKISVWNRSGTVHKAEDIFYHPMPPNTFKIEKGDCIAQMVFIPIVHPTFTVVKEFSNKTKRSDGGFGSTDK